MSIRKEKKQVNFDQNAQVKINRRFHSNESVPIVMMNNEMTTD